MVVRFVCFGVLWGVGCWQRVKDIRTTPVQNSRLTVVFFDVENSNGART
jgi:hypothetical protein